MEPVSVVTSMNERRSGVVQGAGLLGWLVLCFAASAVGALASIDAGSFYRELESPTWGPPGWVFGPVWTFLYLTMGIAAWLVWREPAQRRQRVLALGLFLVQLALNALWSWLFFVWRLGGVAFVEVLLLWLLIAGTMVAFWRIHRLAALLLVPYLLWVAFATALTWALWRANPALLG